MLYSGLWRRYSNFRLRLNLRASTIFGSSFGSRTTWSKKQKKRVFYLYNSLAPQMISVKAETNFRLWLHHLKVFCSVSGSSLPKLLGPRLLLRLRAPAPVPVHSPGSTACSWVSFNMTVIINSKLGHSVTVRYLLHLWRIAPAFRKRCNFLGSSLKHILFCCRSKPRGKL